MITGTASHAEAVAAQKALHHRYMSYLESHELALASIPDPESLVLSHTATVERHSKYCDVLLTYIETLEVLPAPSTPSHSDASSQATRSSPSHSRASKSSHATVLVAQSSFSRKSQSVRSTRSLTTRRSSQVSRSSSTKLSEARVQAELAKKQMARMKDLQELERQKDEIEIEADRKKKQMAATIALTEQAHKIQALEEEVELREKEVVREELGSDFESEDEERPDVTQVNKSVSSDHATHEHRLAVERWVEKAAEDDTSVDKPTIYSELSVEKRLDIERRFKEAFNITQASTTRTRAVPAVSKPTTRDQTQVTFDASSKPIPSTSALPLPVSSPSHPVIPQSRALVVGNEVPATGSFSQVSHPVPQARRDPLRWRQTDDEQQDDMAKILDAITKKQMEHTTDSRASDLYPQRQPRSGYCPPLNTPHQQQSDYHGYKDPHQLVSL